MWSEENNVNVPNASSKGPIDPTELEAFMDDLLKKEMDKNHIVGTGDPR